MSGDLITPIINVSHFPFFYSLNPPPSRNAEPFSCKLINVSVDVFVARAGCPQIEHGTLFGFSHDTFERVKGGSRVRTGATTVTDTPPQKAIHKLLKTSSDSPSTSIFVGAAGSLVCERTPTEGRPTTDEATAGQKVSFARPLHISFLRVYSPQTHPSFHYTLAIHYPRRSLHHRLRILCSGTILLNSSRIVCHLHFDILASQRWLWTRWCSMWTVPR